MMSLLDRAVSLMWIGAGVLVMLTYDSETEKTQALVMIIGGIIYGAVLDVRDGK